MAAFVETMKKIKWKRYLNYIVVSCALVFFSALSMTGSLKSSTLYLLEKMGISILLSVSLGLVVGFLGELSLGHAGFMCVGAYIGGKASALMSNGFIGDGILNLLISVVIGALAAAVLGFVVGLPALRLKGDYLAIVTLAFCEIVKTVFQNSSTKSFGGPMGLRTPRFDKDYLFVIIFAFILICLAVMQNFIRSKHGRAITAIRDNEIAARATGINVTKYKLSAFILSAAFAGVAGVMYSFANHNVSRHAHIVEETDVLEGSCYSLLIDNVLRVPLQFLTVKVEGARSGLVNACEHIEHSGLARAVGAE